MGLYLYHYLLIALSTLHVLTMGNSCEGRRQQLRHQQQQHQQWWQRRTRVIGLHQLPTRLLEPPPVVLLRHPAGVGIIPFHWADADVLRSALRFVL